MASHRLSRLHKQILRWVVADQQRTQGVIASSHADLVKALPAAKGNISRSLRTLEEQGWIVIGRTRGGQAESLYLTPTGHQRAWEIARKL